MITNFYDWLKAYQQNKETITAYFKNQSLEGLTLKGDDGDLKDALAWTGATVTVFLIYGLISFVIWIWAIVVTIKYWNALPSWAKVLAIIGLFPIPGGPILTLIVVYIGKNKGVAPTWKNLPPYASTPSGDWSSGQRYPYRKSF